MSTTVRILSIDGGGIRGIIPGLVLAEIERRCGKPVSELFDLVAGTSTGGIIALGLTRAGKDGKPMYAAADLVDLYRRNGARIFSRSVWHRMYAVGNLAEEKYPASGIESVIEEYLGDARLKDALTEVLITAYEIERRQPWFFKRRHARSRAGHDFPIAQVARATSAAPTYFEPCRIDTADGTDYFAMIDGGMFANNPAMCAYVEALRRNPEATDFLVVSLGTGEMTRPIHWEDAKGWGLLGWARPLLGVIFDGVSDTVSYQLKQVLLPGPDGRRRYYRFQIRLDEGSDSLDDSGRTNLRVLGLLGETIIRDNSDALSVLCEQLCE